MIPVDSERSEPEAYVPELKRQQCPSCRQSKSVDEFYANCAECKPCKRTRSRNNRALQARKIAAFERFVEALFVLADKAGDDPSDRTAKAVA